MIPILQILCLRKPHQGQREIILNNLEKAYTGSPGYRRSYSKNGVKLGEMNMLLLKKIEELTVYAIEINKKTHEVIEKNKNLEEQNKEIQSIKEEIKLLAEDMKRNKK